MLLERSIVFAIAFLAVNFLTPLVISLAHRIGILDRPGERKVHSQGVPRIGGLAIAAGTALALAPGLP